MRLSKKMKSVLRSAMKAYMITTDDGIGFGRENGLNEIYSTQRQAVAIAENYGPHAHVADVVIVPMEMWIHDVEIRPRAEAALRIDGGR